MGVTTGVGSLMNIIGPLWAGAVYDNVIAGAPYWMGAVVLLVAGLMLFRPSTRPQQFSSIKNRKKSYFTSAVENIKVAFFAKVVLPCKTTFAKLQYRI